jgi:glutaconyl-CoA/methylmalonyl-CoA decarboxylase subunit gamma
VLAPIPGVIISIDVKPGDTVEHGTTLCVLEAMKMKNAIRATRAGKIGAVQINVGETVRHNQVLIEFAD